MAKQTAIEVEDDAEIGPWATEFGRRLREARKRTRTTQVQFAAAAGTTQSRVSQLELGKGFSVLERTLDMWQRAGADVGLVLGSVQGSESREPARQDPVLVEIVDAWDRLPSEIRLAMIGIVRQFQVRSGGGLE